MDKYPKWIIDEVKRNKAELREKPAADTAADLRALSMHTVCDEALCPNKGKCFYEGEATFMILGDICTRHCGFCAVKKNAPPLPPDKKEPEAAAALCRKWKLKYVVFTSPTRDDLPDGGASCFAAVNAAIKDANPGIKTEPLVPDFGGDMKALETVLDSNPNVLGHNIEMPEILYQTYGRNPFNYRRSLELLANSHAIRPDIFVKSSIMLGLGESRDDVLRTFDDLLEHHCELLTLGQYLAPSKDHVRVSKYYTVPEFEDLEKTAEKMGFKAVLSGPLVRSSYRAGYLYNKALDKIYGRK